MPEVFAQGNERVISITITPDSPTSIVLNRSVVQARVQRCQITVTQAFDGTPRIGIGTGVAPELVMGVDLCRVGDFQTLENVVIPPGTLLLTFTKNGCSTGAATVLYKVSGDSSIR